MDRQKSAEAVRAGITVRQRAEPVVEARDGLSADPGQMPRKRALKPEVADGIREVRLGAQRRQATTSTKRGTAGTAVYGTGRTVVWEDGGREAPSYPIPGARGVRIFRGERYPPVAFRSRSAYKDIYLFILNLPQPLDNRQAMCRQWLFSPHRPFPVSTKMIYTQA